MKWTHVALCLFVGIVLNLASLGCGSASSTPNSTPNSAPPMTSVAPTPNPLVAQYRISHFPQGSNAWVEFGTDTNYGRQTSVMSDSSTTPGGGALNILVAGMKAQTTYHLRAHVAWQGGSFVDQDQTFTTGSLPASNYPVPTLSVAPPGPGTLGGVTPAPGVELVSLVSSAPFVNDIVTDLEGNVIWLCASTGAAPFKPMANGHFIMMAGAIGIAGTHLREVDLACKRVRDVSVSQVSQSLQRNGYSFVVTGFHHDMLVLPNGHWIALALTTKAFTNLPGYPGTITVTGDALLDIDPGGNVVWAWSAFDHLDVNRHLQGLPDWTHSNAIVYTADGNLLLSMRHQSWILKIDYANGTGSGNVLWRLGDAGDFTLLGGDPSEWFYAQHYPHLVSTNGSQTIFAVFDNGNLRIDASGVACGSTPSAPACYSRATLFQFDESTRLASLLWQDLPGFYSNWGGSIGILPNGDVEFNSSNPFNGAGSQVTEVTQTGTPQIVWQMTITGGAAYRAYRIPSLYPGVAWQQ